ncbi:protein-disulfide reductase DsbD|uniref:protein-disulfide reductase DsbD n=1 Tax=Noviherbaspirillum sp. L7-7A TaxID=2850560 RepID=UPI001C2C8072|nr:protein-disulfide reductase DsbD [Noviherbaspirillum sp. L7-7A]MBV0880993.1 protein-disulfide reductase DsbD [Noviherbaspirillum sp. L7-7A]
MLDTVLRHRLPVWLGLLAMLLSLFAPAVRAADDYLEPEAAFRFASRMLDPGTVEVTYQIAEGYYMYRERFAFRAEGATLGEPVIPPGKVKFDETFQKDVETYRKTVVITIPVQAAGPFLLVATSQGCADKGLCYTPMDSQARLSPTGGGGLLAAARGLDAQGASTAPTASPATDSEMGRIESSLRSGRLLAIMPLFLLLGLGLSFTPCVLPMVPILSFIIVGEGAKATRLRGFVLSATYSLGMAIVYTLLGVSAGLLGEGLSAALQNPWVLSAFALLMAMLSLSMFGVYQLQMPAMVQTRLTQLSEKQTAGKLAGVFVMGALSALIVGPCVAAPLAGALLYISQTRDVVVGGSALFAMAVGMSIPLLAIGLSAGALLPRAGAWMEAVKRFFGVLMLAVALWMVAPVLPGWLQMAGWAALGIGYGAWLIVPRGAGWRSKLAGMLFMLLGAVQLAGLASGGRDPLAPLAHLGSDHHVTRFERVRSIAELDAALAQAKAQGKPAMLDFYADWCVSCKEMEKLTFTDARVRQQFEGMVLLQADVTANNADDRALLKRFRLFGPPGIILFGKDGVETTQGRVIGYQDADRFLRSLAMVDR